LEQGCSILLQPELTPITGEVGGAMTILVFTMQEAEMEMERETRSAMEVFGGEAPTEQHLPILLAHLQLLAATVMVETHRGPMLIPTVFGFLTMTT
jgi:hypothetical protein